MRKSPLKKLKRNRKRRVLANWVEEDIGEEWQLNGNFELVNSRFEGVLKRGLWREGIYRDIEDGLHVKYWGQGIYGMGWGPTIEVEHMQHA